MSRLARDIRSGLPGNKKHGVKWMKSSLAEHMTQSVSARVERFYSLCFPVCEFIEKQHREGKVLGKLNPEVIHVDPQTRQVELKYDSHTSASFLPYISPEQTGKIIRQVDHRSDLYSLGVVYYELLTGELPFRADDVLGWSYAHVAIEPKSPDKVNPDVPLMLSSIIMKLLRKSPDERYQSVVGLKADLHRCWVEWQARGASDPFPLGQMDLFMHLRSESELFGRDKETATLMAAYDRVCQGNMELVIVSGYSGVGKTALVNHFRQKVLDRRGSFAYSGFAQCKEDASYTAVIHTIRELVQQIIVDRLQKNGNWETMSNGMFDANEDVLMQTCVKLQRLLDEFQASGNRTFASFESRLFELCKSLLQMLLQSEQPFVMFLDDLQRLDSVTVKLIQALITDVSQGRMLLIGAYRTGEVSKMHPVFSLIQSLADKHISVTHMMLKALDLTSTQQFVRSMLKCKEKDLTVLSNGIFHKSAGNPLYIKQIIKQLYNKGYLYLSSEELCWKCDYEGLRSIPFDESLLELVLERMLELPPETINLLKLASCLGRGFDSAVLAVSLNRAESSIREILQPAINLDVIIEQNRVDLLNNVAQKDEDTNRWYSGCYEFLHDRVVEVVYSLMSDEEKKEAHLQVGRAILKKDSTASCSDVIAAVNHLNLGMDLIRDEGERLQLAEYNLRVVKEAKASIQSAGLLQYLEAGMKLLPKNSWDFHYRLMFDLYMEYYRCKFVQNGFCAAEPIFNLLESKAKSQSDKVELYCQRTVLCVGHYTDEEAIRSGLSALKLTGLKIPMSPNKGHLLQEILYIRLRLFGRKVESLLDYPEMEDERARKIMTILVSLIPPASVSNPELFSYILLKMTSISLKHGNTDYSAFGYACYGVICSQFGDVRKAMEFRDVSLALAERHGSSACKCTVYYAIAVYLNHWSTHLRQNLDYAEKSYHYARESGDTLLAGSIQTEMVQIRYVMGESLRAIHRQNAVALAENRFYNMSDLVDILQTVNQFIKNLRGETFGPFTFSSIDYDEDIVADRMVQTNSGIIVPFYYLMKMQSYYLHGKPEESFRIALELHNELGVIEGKILYAEHVYWACLSALAAFSRLQEDRKRKAAKVLRKNLSFLKTWSQMCEDNFSHKYHLVSAERAGLNGNNPVAMNMYERAIVLALKNGYLFDAAIACELAAEFYLKLGFEQNGHVHLVNAYKLFAKYGAALKLKFLRAKYPEILSELEHIPVQDYTEVDELDGGSDERYIDGSAKGLEAFSGIGESADFVALREMSDSFLKSLNLYDSLKKVLGVIVKSSGAQRACLLGVKKDGIFVIGGKECGHEPVICHKEQGDDGFLPFSYSVVMYVINTGKPLVLGDASCGSLFKRERHIQDFGVKSVMCLPIFLQDNLEGILYIENNLGTCVFSMEYANALGKLALQAINAWKLARRLDEKDFGSIDASSGTLVSFTDKETRIIELMVEGLSNLEIAERLHLSEGTIKWHSNKIFRKLGVKSRTQAVLKVNELRVLQKHP